MNHLEQLAGLGQSIWLDNIDRRLLDSGDLQRLIAQGVRGLTSNPSIFEKAIAGSTAYDVAIAALAREGMEAEPILERLIVEDIRRAADLFLSVFERSGGNDGFVSIEVSPALAHDSAATIAAARRLWGLVDRPNAMIKIPATPEGIPAIRQCVTEGININATLIFSVNRYKEVIAAYRAGLEARAAQGGSLTVASVASFFVSRVDGAVDRLLEKQGNPDARSLLGKVAVANAVLAYCEFQLAFAEPWFTPLAALGARPQRPLWASTGVKNPKYSDLLYCEPLIGRDTVNTLPPATLSALLDHGVVRTTLGTDGAEAQAVIAALARAGISLEAVTEALEAEGVALFAKSYVQVLSAVAAKRDTLPTRAVAA